MTEGDDSAREARVRSARSKADGAHVLRLSDMRRLFPLVLLAAACGGRSGPTPKSGEVGFRVVGVGANADPTLRPARLVPETVDESTTYGTEPGGGTRAITSGLRVVTSPQGAVLAAEDRLPQAPQLTTPLPDRLGGGFLYVLGQTIWRSDRWLGPAKPIFTSMHAIETVVPGLDRVYVRANNTYVALDGRTGQPLDLGPWPQSPYVSSFAAADGWRAAAIVDLRGLVATSDAGATWRAIDLPIEARQIVVAGDSLAVGGLEGGKNEAWFEIRPDGGLSRMSGPPRDAQAKVVPMTAAPRPASTPSPFTFPPTHAAPPATVSSPPPKEVRDEGKDDPALRTFGKRPLVAAIEDGWPLTDGTAVVARDGAIARIRLSDGAITEMVPNAFPLKPARCHAVSLTRPQAVGAFGFVCGETRGTTAIYAYDPFRGRLSEIKRFDKPRVVTSSGNGALAVRGSCAEDADPPPGLRPEVLKNDKEKETAPAAEAPAEVHPYCVLGHDNVWREIHVRGDLGGERVVVMSDGKIVVVTPPHGASVPARITVLEKGGAHTNAITFPKVPADVARVLRLGLWLDGFEERRPGVVGGWLEAGGIMLGIEIGLDGKATPGQFIRDAGNPFVAGRYGFGWTGARRGYETTDGGMTWTGVDLPDALPGKLERRACGPIGCIAGGWLRVGWGETKRTSPPAAPPAVARIGASLSPPSIMLACEPLAPSPPSAPPPRPRTPQPATAPSTTRRFPSSPPVLGGFTGLTDLPPFYHHAGPPLRDAERGMQFEIRELPDRASQAAALARVYVWGPKTGDWDTQGRWQVRWISPFAGWPEVRSSAAVLPPQMIVDLSRAGAAYTYGYGAGLYHTGTGRFAIATGDDTTHALLAIRKTSQTELALFEVEADRAPIEIRRADGEPFGEFDGFVRAAGRWFFASLATPASPHTSIWQIDGAVARELVRVPRAGVFDGRRPTSSSRLARRSDGRAIGLVVDGQPNGSRSGSIPIRWVLPIDLETGQLGDPEPLGYTDLAGRTVEACTDDVLGWTVDAPLGVPVRLRTPRGQGSLSQVYARMRLTSTRACIENLSGYYDGQTPERAAQLTGGRGTPRAGDIVASVVSMQQRHPLRCTVAR